MSSDELLERAAACPRVEWLIDALMVNAMRMRAVRQLPDTYPIRGTSPDADAWWEQRELDEARQLQKIEGVFGGFVSELAPLVERVLDAAELPEVRGDTLDLSALRVAFEQLKGFRYYANLPDPLLIRDLKLQLSRLERRLKHAASTAASTADQKTTPATGFASPKDLAGEHGISQDSIRKALAGWRKNNAGGDGYIQDTDRRNNEPEFLYDREKVRPVLERLKQLADRREMRRKKTAGRLPAQK